MPLKLPCFVVWHGVAGSTCWLHTPSLDARCTRQVERHVGAELEAALGAVTVVMARLSSTALDGDYGVRRGT
jgi:hypothetical protein